MIKMIIPVCLPLLILAAPAQADEPYASVSLRVRQADGSFAQVDTYVRPRSTTMKGWPIAFEGIGWESDRIAYRLYLDARYVTDIYGKRLPGPVLDHIGQGRNDYTAPSPWGQDVFQVGNSLGIGGLGLLRDGIATQVGPSDITAKVVENGPAKAVAEVDNDGVDGGGHLHAAYSLKAGSTVTEVNASGTGLQHPLVAGFADHHVTVLRSTLKLGATWAYVASWGKQSLAGDDLGLVIFYRLADVVGPPASDGQSLYVQFRDPKSAHYAFAARWQAESGGEGAVNDKAAFISWLDATLARF
ncbi:MAG: DUF4861 family protein [Asticcacaulis sp.]|nr:DUF4861 family protein [Asticcacaulis sp.]